ncbi:small acid-soluble spore protein SspI [Sporosarcina sp. P21c]|uniref:small acid-soluble spore protein SspI n=1 Tax=Sporosarcina TaxID=1569 RepID=UPI000A1576B2|nr:MULTISPECIES: small acid-soluble spore protein SspI [Sporosarcina]ARJ37947.1 small acid-soluble spore protein SspI [Sporosarcina ureae]PIC67739.1 small acid-soluble spore protein SspI [Sporosarcina sp. P16a]PIC83732.1 small acid-soluble spore protein SspI [Sporosarcina sp. P1]PIC90598.1 small acid-soluble spore protein SspI [Sporosarcina sp. P21c]PIC93364.1 small acid-soluble spore protein SspI [Sporosarcina sp. P25]
MNFQIRDAISANMTNNSSTDVRGVIDDAIQRGEEHLLPGLGVFFEQLWKRADETEKVEITNELSQAFAQAQ